MLAKMLVRYYRAVFGPYYREFKTILSTDPEVKVSGQEHAKQTCHYFLSYNETLKKTHFIEFLQNT